MINDKDEKPKVNELKELTELLDGYTGHRWQVIEARYTPKGWALMVTRVEDKDGDEC